MTVKYTNQYVMVNLNSEMGIKQNLYYEISQEQVCYLEQVSYYDSTSAS